jgi:hypothetical protein
MEQGEPSGLFALDPQKSGFVADAPTIVALPAQAVRHAGMAA